MKTDDIKVGKVYKNKFYDRRQVTDMYPMTNRLGLDYMQVEFVERTVYHGEQPGSCSLRTFAKWAEVEVN